MARQPSHGRPRPDAARRRKIGRFLALFGGIALAGMGLVGCPIPQPLSDTVVVVDGGSFYAYPPPRIVADSVSPSDTVVLVNPTNCDSVSLVANVHDDIVDEDVEARWFVDYDKNNNFKPDVDDTQSGMATHDDKKLVRALDPFSFVPSRYSASGDTHVVDLVVSNGFLPPTAAGSADAGVLPSRATRPGYETQVYRWVIELTPNGGCP